MQIRLLFVVVLALTLTSCSKKEEGGQLSTADSSASGLPAKPEVDPQVYKIDEKDRHFVAAVSIGLKTEIDLAKIAIVRSQTPAIKSFAQSLHDEYAKVRDELQQLATSKNIPYDTLVSAMQSQTKAYLAQQSGKAFDKEYASFIQRDHELIRGNFETTANEGVDLDLKAYAQKHLALITQNLEKTQQMSGSFR